jgi:hypothetical protein
VGKASCGVGEDVGAVRGTDGDIAVMQGATTVSEVLATKEG